MQLQFFRDEFNQFKDLFLSDVSFYNKDYCRCRYLAKDFKVEDFLTQEDYDEWLAAKNSDQEGLFDFVGYVKLTFKTGQVLEGEHHSMSFTPKHLQSLVINIFDVQDKQDELYQIPED